MRARSRHRTPGRSVAPVHLGQATAGIAAALVLVLALAVGAGAQSTVTVTVNGTPIGDEAPPQDTCALVVEVAGLPAEGGTEVRTAVSGIPPSVPDGTELVLIDATSTATGATWTATLDVSPHLEQLSHHGNGYRVRLDVWLDGDPAGSQRAWLRCDDERPRHPTRMLFEVHWLTHEGVPVAGPLDAVLPVGWRTAFRLDATSDKGTATCTYPDGGDVLVCTYDNPGHEEAPGLVVPGRPTATYDVAVAGVPAGAVADPDALGTFVGREECPRGHDGGHEGGHGGGGGGGHQTAVTDLHEEEPIVCTHAVDVALPPPPPTTTTTTPATTTPPSSPVPTTAPVGVAGVDVSAPTAGPSAGTLPATGSSDALLALAGLGLVGLGVLALRLRTVAAAGRAD